MGASAGRIDAGESSPMPPTRIARETGYTAANWTKLASFWPTGYVAEQLDIYRASDLTEGAQEPMEDERIEIRWFSSDEIHDWIRTGKIKAPKP